MNKAKFITEVTVIDPDSKGEVEVAMFKHENGGIFGIDSSYIDQVFGDDELVVVLDPFSHERDLEYVTLMGVY